MGFLMAKSLFPQSQSMPSSLSPLSSPLLSPHRNLLRNKIVAMGSMDGERPGGGLDSSPRRAVLLVGISVLPLLQLKAIAFEGRGMRRGARTLEEARRKPRDAEDKQGMSEVEAPKQPAQEISSQELNQSEQVNIQGAPETSTKPSVDDTQQPEEVFSSKEANEIELRNQQSGPANSQNSEADISRQTEPEISEMNVQNASGSSFLSFLNELGIVGSGVLGALYATSKKDKLALESTIESMKTKLSENERATVALKEDLQTSLLNEQEERQKQVRRFKEEEALLSNQLSSANARIAALLQELQVEKKLTQELEAQIQQLRGGIIQAGEDRKMLETKLKEKTESVDALQDRVSLLSLEINDKEKNIKDLRLSLAEKEAENENLSSIIDQSRADLAGANSAVEQLKEEMLRTREELHARNSSIEDLKEKVKLLSAENDGTKKEIDDLLNEYTDLKSSYEKRVAHDSELLSKKDDELHRLEEKLGVALSETRSSQAMIAELTKERDDIRVMLEKEVKGIRLLKDELQTTKEILGASRFEALNLSKELDEEKRSHSELISMVAKMQNEFNEAQDSLNSNLYETKSALKVLSDELRSIEGVLESTKDELSVTSHKLNAVMEDREKLKKELVDIYKKLETAAQELKEERKVVTTLNRELEILGKQMQKDSEARRALQSDLDEATKSLDEMNKSTLLLSKELERTNARTASLEAEKEMLYHSLMEQKNLAKEAREDVEDSQSLIMRLGSERENLEKKTKKFEEELAAAKGEILRLRRQISMNNESNQKMNEVPAGTPFSAKKTVTRRRKGGSPSDMP